MKNSRILLLAVLSITLAFSPAAQAGWMSFTTSVLKAEKKGKHPETLNQMLIVRRNTPRARICVAYLNDLEQRNKGRVVSTATVTRGDETIETMTFAGPVRRNTLLKCKTGVDLLEGDMVAFTSDLKGMPGLKKGNFLEVNGVVSTAGEPKIESFGLAPTDSGGWVHAASSVFFPEKHNQEHPRALERTVMMPRDAADAQACSAYVNTSGKKKAGRILTNVLIERADGSEETVQFAGGVRRNSYLKCKSIGDVGEGDLAHFTFDLLQMPALERASKRDRQLADIHGAITTALTVDFQEPGAGGGGKGGAAISAEDQRAVSSLLYKTTKTQLWRPKADSPAKWVVLGPQTRAISGNTLDLSTAGLGGTIAAAFADYQRKKGGLPAGDLLSARDVKGLQWYSEMNSAAGPTAVRRDGGGGYHADYFRPGKGSVITGGFGSVAAVLEFLQREGL